jgi:2,3-bisphosphoglycerate-independent phosphoglycerate mutase
MNEKVVLMILDGWGIGNRSKSDAISQANTPVMDGFFKKYPHAQLLTDGENVGLPNGQMGNSEVGHLNIGAGRVVYQDLVKINKAFENNEIASNNVIVEAFEKAQKEGVAIHFMGLVSDGGVHSSQQHLHGLCNLANQYNLKKVYIHAFTDGRDTDPKSGLGFLKLLQNHIRHTSIELVSVVGRYYAMDRDNRWERIKKAYDLLIHGEADMSKDLIESVQNSYENNVTDEFILPIVKVDDNNNPIGRIKSNDIVICFNYRTDRCREITQALTQTAFHEYNMHPLSIHYITFTNYDSKFKNVHVVFDKDNLNNTLGEVLSKYQKKQIRIAETEKYPHVTFFFSGGRELEFEGEKRILVNSPKVATYDLKPEMSAYELTDAILEELKRKETDFVCLNFANPDMVGHTGVYEAVVKAVETVDECMGRVVKTGIDNGYSFIIIADHGNADFVINEDGSPNTAHTTNPVPCVLISNNYTKIKNGILADVAPTILKMMQISQPTEMTGKSLVG